MVYENCEGKLHSPPNSATMKSGSTRSLGCSTDGSMSTLATMRLQQRLALGRPQHAAVHKRPSTSNRYSPPSYAPLGPKAAPVTTPVYSDLLGKVWLTGAADAAAICMIPNETRHSNIGGWEGDCLERQNKVLPKRATGLGLLVFYVNNFYHLGR